MKKLGLKEIFLISLAIKILLAIVLPLSPDESYYWVWSHHLQLSYFDHPPFVSWLFLLGHPFENVLSAVRIPAVIMGHLTICLWYLLLKDELSEQKRLWFFALALFMPLIGPGSLIITPDLPLMFFAALTLLLTKSLVKTPSPFLAFSAGLSLGLGFASKYTMVLMVPVIVIWLAKEKESRQKYFQFLTLGILGFSIASLPVWAWNYQHNWTSFGFQTSHGFVGRHWSPRYAVDYILGQVGLIFPTVIYFAIRGLKFAPTWLRWTAVFPVAFFFLSSLSAYAEANWPILAHPAFLALAFFSTHQLRWAKITVAVWALAFVLALTEVFFQWLPFSNLKTRELSKYDRVIETVESYSPVFARSYQMASKLSFELKRPIYKLRGLNRMDFYDSLSQSIPSTQYFYLILEKNEKLSNDLRAHYKIIKRENIDTQFELVSVEVL